MFHYKHRLQSPSSTSTNHSNEEDDDDDTKEKTQGNEEGQKHVCLIQLKHPQLKKQFFEQCTFSLTIVGLLCCLVSNFFLLLFSFSSSPSFVDQSQW
jgi:hypothetical protein